LVRSLNTRLSEKSRQLLSYDFKGQVVLAIWWGSLMYNEKFDIDFIQNNIIVPENYYSEIWLIIKDADYTPLLYPLKTKN
jgi:hypothetical protein